MGRQRRGRVPAAAPLDTGVRAPLAAEQTVVTSGLLLDAEHKGKNARGQCHHPSDVFGFVDVVDVVV